MEEALKQRNFQSTQRRLMELGRLGPKKVDADSMIEAIIGKKEAEKQKSKRKLHPEMDQQSMICVASSVFLGFSS